MWAGFMGNAYPYSQLEEFYNEAIETKDIEIIKTKKCAYFNIPAAFDIETTSWTDGKYPNGSPIHMATMYIWQFGLNGSVIYGRTWEEFERFLAFLEAKMGLSEYRHLIIYVHNLAYEFQFLRRRPVFNWDKVFAIKRRRPAYAICGGFEFRCSLFLSNYALEYIGDRVLVNYKVQKLTGSLDYSLPRHSKTPLTKRELSYCINDVRVVMSYIQEKIEHDGDITKIPLTNTGYVRNYCRKECFYENVESEEEREKIRLAYRAIMKSLQVSSEEEYEQLHRAFMGGFTHASCVYAASETAIYNVGSADLASSYPYTLVAEYFPMSSFTFVGACLDADMFKHYLSKYCCIFDIQFIGLKPRLEFENIISISRVWDQENVRVNNGRIISADKLSTTLTELDFDSIIRFYQWDAIKVTNLRIARRGYLPKALILAVLDLYEDKTKLKGIADKAMEYLVAKGMINAAYGMMVTAIIRDEYLYDNDEGWERIAADVSSQLDGYNSNFNRFLYYGWGVWVTAHARHNLFSAILEFGEDYLYSDTDSIKGINFNDHTEYFSKYNGRVFDKLLAMCNHYNIDFNKVRPLNKMIGVWDVEPGYLRFRSAGAKRYIYENIDYSLGMTCAGINKKFAVPYLLWELGGGKNLEDEAHQWLEDYNYPLLRRDPGPFIKLARIAYAEKDGTPWKDAKEWLIEQRLANKIHYEPIFYHFKEGLYIPPEHTGKMTLDYIDRPLRGILTDFTGLPAIVEEYSAVYMEPQHYYMSQAADYLKLLSNIREEVY